METSNCFDEQKLITDRMILNAMMVVDYYPRIYGNDMSIEVEQAFVKVYNCFVDELIERGILEC